MNTIKNVNFGFSDAITEMERAPKNFDLSFFDPSDYLNELINGNRFIVCGKKGDGKTAYGAKLNLNTTINTYNRTLNNFNNQIFKEIKTYDHLGGNPYISFWKSILMIESVKMLHKFRPQIQNEEYVRIFDALNRKGFLELDTDISVTVSKLVESNTSFDIHNLINHGRKKEYIETLQGAEQIYATIKKAIQNIYLDKEKYYLIIDGLDDILTNTEFKSEIITGLLRASDEINRIFSKTTLFLKIIILIRTDVLNICRDANLSKLRRDSMINLTWRIDGDPFVSDLLTLVKKRFDVAWNSDIRMQDIWYSIFPETIYDKPSIDYVLENIIYRPRDILQFFIEVQKEYKGNNRLSEDQIQTILYNYSSEYFINAMLDELTGFFPDDTVSALPDILSKLGSKFFYAKDFYDICKNYPMFDDVILHDLLEKLFLDGYIGQHRPRVSKEYTVFKYRNPREKFQEEDECIIHRGLLRSLTMN